MEDGASPARILIIEDDTDLRETLWRALSREGYQVSQAGDGTEAISAVRMRPYDLAIVDLVLPRMGGIGMLEQLRDLGLRSPRSSSPPMETALPITGQRSWAPRSSW